VKLALFAFEPFGPWDVNTTDVVTQRVAEELRAEGVRVVRKVLPVVLGEAPQELLSCLDAEQPDAVLATGLAGLRPDIDVERIAVNVADFRIPDNSGFFPQGDRLDPAGPDAWLVSVNVHAMRDRIAAAGARSRVSNTAGTYLCNAIHYHLLSWSRPRGVPGMFLHIPPLPEAAEAGSRRAPEAIAGNVGMELRLQVAGVAEGARFLLEAAGAAARS
jgi:pyroglutamyl-peptidase